MNLHCWICMQTDNVNIVNEEWICDECLRELAEIEEEENGKGIDTKKR